MPSAPAAAQERVPREAPAPPQEGPTQHALAFYQHRRWGEAVRAFAALPSRNPHLEARYGHCLLMADRPRDAAFYLALAKAKLPQDPRIVLWYAASLHRSGASDDAITVISHLIREGHDSAAARRNLGALYYLQGDYERAREAEERAIELDPRDVESYLNLAVTLISLRRLHEAESRLRQAALRLPESDRIHATLAVLAYQLGRPQEALARLREALVLNGDSGSHWLNLGVVKDTLDDPEGAETAYLRAARLGSPSARLHLAGHLLRRARYQEAIHLTEVILSADPGHRQASQIQAEARRRIEAFKTMTGGPR